MANIKLVETFKEMCESGITSKNLEYMDKELTHVLNSAGKHAEGPKRNVPFSRKKVKLTSATLCWKSKKKLLKGGQVNIDVIEKRRCDSQIEDDMHLTEKQVTENLKNATSE